MTETPPDHSAEHQQHLEAFARQVEEQLYSDPISAKRMLEQLAAQLDRVADPGVLRVRVLLLRGNLANLEYNFEEADKLLHQAANDAQEEGLPELSLEASIDRLGPLLNLEQLSQSFGLLETLHAEFTAYLKDPLRIWLATREGFLHLRLDEAEDALRAFAVARQNDLEGSRTSKEAYYEALLHAGYGRLYHQAGELDRSAEAYQLVIRICNEHNLRARLPYHLLELGRVYMEAGRRAEATEQFLAVIEAASRHDQHALGSARANLGYFAYEDQNWTQACRYFQAAQHHYQQAGSAGLSEQSVVALWRARMQRELQEHDEAEQSLIASFEFARQSSDNAQLAQVCAEIANYYADLGKYREAYEYRLAYEDIRQEVEAAQRDLHLRELELKSELEQRRREGELLQLKAVRLQLKALRAQMNPHFMFNALNAIQEFITSNRSAEAAGHLAHFAQLMRQSLDYSERDFISLEEERAFLINYLELNQKLRFQDGFTYRLTVDDELEDDLIGLPAMLVQPYVENAIEHGIRQVENGHISLHFSSPPADDSRLIIVITDNGVGRAAAQQRNQGKRSAHKSMGTLITKNRLDLLNRGQAEETAVRYEDLYTAAGRACGTRVTIELPIHWL